MRCEKHLETSPRIFYVEPPPITNYEEVTSITELQYKIEEICGSIPITECWPAVNKYLESVGGFLVNPIIDVFLEFGILARGRLVSSHVLDRENNSLSVSVGCVVLTHSALLYAINIGISPIELADLIASRKIDNYRINAEKLKEQYNITFDLGL